MATLAVSNGNSPGTMQRILKTADPAKRELTILVTPSIDISIYPEDGTGQNQLLTQAGLAMCEAKDEDKNKFPLLRRADDRGLSRAVMALAASGAMARGEAVAPMDLVGRLGRFAAWLVTVGWFFHGIRSGMEPATRRALPPAAIILLGSGSPDCEASPTLMAGLEQGMAQARRWPSAKVVVSGGLDFGGRCREADIMADTLIARGMAPDRILREQYRGESGVQPAHAWRVGRDGLSAHCRGDQ